MTGKNTDLVVIGYAYGQAEAALAGSILQASGIAFHIQTQGLGSVAWSRMVALGGMALMVPAAEGQAALDVLSDFSPERRRFGIGWTLFFVLTTLYLSVPPPASGYFALRTAAVVRARD